MGGHRSDVPTAGRPGEHAREGVGHKVKKSRGGRIPLAKAPAIREEIANKAVNSNGSMATRDQLHDTMNISTVEPFGKKELLEERPTDRVIRFFKV